MRVVDGDTTIEVFALNEKQYMKRRDKRNDTWDGPALVTRERRAMGCRDRHTWVADPDVWKFIGMLVNTGCAIGTVSTPVAEYEGPVAEDHLKQKAATEIKEYLEAGGGMPPKDISVIAELLLLCEALYWSVEKYSEQSPPLPHPLGLGVIGVMQRTRQIFKELSVPLGPKDQITAYPEPLVWQPIETAPKDRRILGFDPHLKRPFVMIWNVPGQCFAADGTAFEDETPTHWMPLPPTP